MSGKPTVSPAVCMRLATAFLAAVFTLLVGKPLLPEARSFEAAFQGECREDSPCQHICFDLHDGTFECSCREGYTLEVNGYSCIENSRLKESKNWNGSSSSWSDNETLFEDIINSDSNEHLITFDTVKLSLSNTFSHLNKNSENVDKVYVDFEYHNDAGAKFMKKPISYEHLRKVAAHGRSLNSLHEKNSDYKSQKTNSVPIEGKNYSLTIEPLPTPLPLKTVTSCSELQCKSGGICESDISQDINEIRCKCPLGRTGSHCEEELYAQYPRFREGSYLILPALQDAHKSMQMTMEFYPEANDGLLLFSGEDFDLPDFMSISLNKGFIEFRFDCGMGEGVLTTDQPVLLHSWNSLTIYRDRWDAWMQLNSGSQVQGRSKGLLSRISFHLNLYIGGTSNITLVSERTASVTNFKGCLRHLAINRKVYDFRPEGQGDALDGIDIGECSDDVCTKIVCYNGGQCIAVDQKSGTCLCPLGFTGSKCQSAVVLTIPFFNGSSYLQYAGLGNTVLSFIELQIVFKPYKPDGVLFYNGFKMDGTGDFLSVNLVNGFIECRFDLGTGPSVIRSIEPVEMNMWHTVFISRTGRDGIMEVNRQPKVRGSSPGAFTQMSLPLNMYIGGIHDLKDISTMSRISTSFTGCIQKVVLNGKQLNLIDDALSGVNIANCAHSCTKNPCQNGGYCEPRMEYYICHCHLGYAGNDCEKEVSEMIAEPMFTGTSYLHYMDENIVKRIRGNKIEIRLKFRSFSPNGLLLWSGRKDSSSSSDNLSLGLKYGYLHFEYNLGSGKVIIIYNNTRVDDGKWHFLHITRMEQKGSLIVDGNEPLLGSSLGPMNQLNINDGLYLGGMTNIGSLSHSNYHSGLVGCLTNVTLSTDFHVRLITHASTGINIEPCL